MSGPDRLHAFDAAIALAPQGEGAWQGHTSPAYANMIGPFGGVTAAQALNAVLQHPQRLGEPVAFTVNFAAALADGPFLRPGPAGPHQPLDPALDRRDAAGRARRCSPRPPSRPCGATPGARPRCPCREVPRPQDVPPPGTCAAASNGSAATTCASSPGGFPAPGTAPRARTAARRLWVRDNPPRPLDFASLTALSRRVLPAHLAPARHHDADRHGVDDRLLPCRRGAAAGHRHRLPAGPGQAQAFRNGYFDQTAQLWNEAGELLATTHQVVYYKE